MAQDKKRKVTVELSIKSFSFKGKYEEWGVPRKPKSAKPTRVIFALLIDLSDVLYVLLPIFITNHSDLLVVVGLVFLVKFIGKIMDGRFYYLHKESYIL